MTEELLLQAIAKLESRMVEIEGELEQAAQDQDLTAVANLGQEYEETESELERTLEKWGG
jgi:predicted S18 family serine protease